MDLSSNEPGNVFPNCWKAFDSWYTPEYCTHNYWNPVSFHGTSRDSLFIFQCRRIRNEGRWTFPTNQVMSFPIVEKRLIPGKLHNTVHTTFGTQFPFLELVVILSLFFNAEELEMNLFRLCSCFHVQRWNSLLLIQ
jgi:hypothetical protein